MVRSVLIYTYYNSPSSNYNLSFFVNQELKNGCRHNNIDYIIVINGFSYDTENIEFPALDNLTILLRENKGYDFGGHFHALRHLEEEGLLHSYNFYFFMNSGVIGPILPHYQDRNGPAHWSNYFINKVTDRVKLVGTSIVCLPAEDAGGKGPKVEGFFFMTDRLGLALLLEEGNIFCEHLDKRSAIINGEYGLSNCIFKRGYTIDCMLTRYQGVDWTDLANHSMNACLHPSRKNSFYGCSIDPYEVIFHKWFWHGCEPVNLDVIRQYVDHNYRKKLV
uniref:Glycosyltransferase n=1 Tax=viral metagenome TaxID=1070528 RepID=A0A6C0I4G3_9ZZZZ